MNIKDIYKPRRMENIQFDGFSKSITLPGHSGKIIQKGSFTSFDSIFNTYARNIAKMFKCNEANLNKLLVVIKRNNLANIYENFPLTTEIIAKRSVKKGQPVFDSDIADIVGVSFSDSEFDLNPDDGDKIIWIFRESFSFGLYFDLTGQHSKLKTSKELAHLFLKVKYYRLYENINVSSILDLVSVGWFPFIQLIGKDHESLLSLIKEKRFDHISEWSIGAFTNQRISEITDSWWNNDHFRNKKTVIEEAISCFSNGQYAACISTLTPLVEGITNEYYYTTTGKGLKYSGQAITNAISKLANSKFSENSLTFPDLFVQYLNDHFYKNTKGSVSEENVRHTVSHGRASSNSFNRENALKIILTLDQIRFYLPA